MPELPETWRVNSAVVESDDTVRAWTIVYVPESAQGYVRIEQGFDADAAWASRVLRGQPIRDLIRECIGQHILRPSHGAASTIFPAIPSSSPKELTSCTAMLALRSSLRTLPGVT